VKKIALTLLFVTAAAGGARATAWLNGTAASLWTSQPLSMDGGQEQWSKSDTASETSVAFRVMNDASDLYLLITPMGRDGKGLLSGGYRQDAALWFLSPDQKTRSWGLRVPYSRLDQLTSGTTQAQTVEPECVAMQDTEVSTAPMPGGVSFHLEFDERKPMIEIRLALKSLPAPDVKTVLLEFTTTAVPPVIAAQIRNEKIAPGAPGGGRRGGRRRRGGGQGSPQGATQASSSVETQAGAPGEVPDEVPGTPLEAPTVPDMLDLQLAVKLASGPQ
jgi:hypothetical protein